MSFKDLARMEGYDLDAMEAEAKLHKEIIRVLRWTNEQLLVENQRLEQELVEARTKDELIGRLSEHIQVLEEDNMKMREDATNYCADTLTEENKVLKAKVSELEEQVRILRVFGNDDIKF